MNVRLSQVNYSVGDIQILRDVSLEVEEGQILVLLGPNGAGKSTLLRLVSGFLDPADGKVEVSGSEISKISLHERAKMMGVLTQRVALDFPFTAEEVMAMGRTPFGRGRLDIPLLDELAVELGIVKRQNYLTMSGGERQLVQVARVFAQVWGLGKKALLLMDEPMTALDLKHQVDVVSIMQRLAREGVTQIVVMHDINMAASIADKVVLMSDGQIVAHGNPEEVLNAELLERTFDTPVDVADMPYFRAKVRS